MIIDYISTRELIAMPWPSLSDELTLKKSGTDWHVIRGKEVLASLPLEEALKFARKKLNKPVSKK